ncbi:hypothetical protein HanXRQr2_Chr14g0645841 [Helianthus annuus]|uniref:Uncharacterized protein n=1 Tax=Helianthus annuus TaxID=4232 RepID=A0A9K3E9W2_HELAN|nr:hypothetical protein HanXRQr2_Chr14g0645841 [Helianthus annuus]
MLNSHIPDEGEEAEGPRNGDNMFRKIRLTPLYDNKPFIGNKSQPKVKEDGSEESLDWKFSQVFGECTVGEEVQEAR